MAQDTNTPQTDPIILAAQQSKAQSEARTADYTARTAEVTARNASAKAAVDALPTSTTTGTVTPGTDAGKAEATLLAAKAANTASATIVGAVGSAVAAKPVTIFAGSERPTLDHLAAFNLRLQLLQNAVAPKAQALDAAAVAALRNVTLPAVPPGGHASAQIVDPMTIALGLTALTKIAGLFQTDYSVGGITLATDHDALATAVAGGLAARPAGSRPASVTLFSRSTNATAGAKLLALITPVAGESAMAQARVAFFQERAKTVRAAANAKDQAMVDAAAACDQAVAAWQLVANGFDTLLQGLTTADAAGNLPIARIADEQRLFDALDAGSLVLFVQMNASVGGFYTRKNIGNAFGGQPFFVAAGVVTSYTLIGGKDGGVIAAGLVPVHGGYHRAPDVAAYVNGTDVR